MRVHHEKKSDGVTVHHKKNRVYHYRVRVYHYRKNDGVRVHYEKE